MEDSLLEKKKKKKGGFPIIWFPYQMEIQLIFYIPLCDITTNTFKNILFKADICEKHCGKNYKMVFVKHNAPQPYACLTTFMFWNIIS